MQTIRKKTARTSSGIADVVNFTKNNGMLNDAQNCIEKVFKMSRLQVIQGECAETQHCTAFEIDAGPNRTDREFNLTRNQHHLMRSLLCVISVSEKWKRARESLCIKK